MLLAQLKQRAQRLEAESYALFLAARHPRTPWYARLFVAAIVAYALSPIDLIPDFIPVLGYVDELILLPLAIALAMRMIPPAVLDECRQRADEVVAHGKPASRTAAAVIIAIWVAAAVMLAHWAYQALASR
jgi:uncharacterized membrane protein YkvA (DUF1232 family)